MVGKRQRRFNWPAFGFAVGIVALLVEMLMPPFLMAREKARRAGCLCNLKSLGLAIRLYSVEQNERFPTDALKTTVSSFALLTNAYLTPQKENVVYLSSHKTLMCPTDTGVSSCGWGGPRGPANVFVPCRVSYAYGGFGLSETAQPDTPIACDRTTGDLRSARPYANNKWTHKTDGGCVLFADGHVAWQREFRPPMYNGKNP